MTISLALTDSELAEVSAILDFQDQAIGQAAFPCEAKRAPMAV